MDALLGGKPDPENHRIRELLPSTKAFWECTIWWCTTWPYCCLASVHAEVSDQSDIVAIHEVIDDAEREIGAELHMPICIHMDPIATKNENTNRVHRQMADFLRNTDPCLSLHDFRMVLGAGSYQPDFRLRASRGL